MSRSLVLSRVQSAALGGGEGCVIKWIVEKELSSYSMKEEPGERQDWRRGNQNSFVVQE